MDYNGDFWPTKITSKCDDDILDWIEEHICLIPLYPRKDDYDVYENASINQKNARNLSLAADKCWNAILNKDLKAYSVSAFTRGTTVSISESSIAPLSASAGVLVSIGSFAKTGTPNLAATSSVLLSPNAA